MKTLFALLFMGFYFTQAQQVYYVSPGGSDSNPGTFSQPWQHVQHGIDAMSSGDTLKLKDGVYFERIYIDKNHVSIKALHHGQAIIDGTGTGGTQDALIEINHASFVEINGLVLKNNIQNDAQGILVEGSGSHIRIENCVIHDIHFSSDPNETPTSNKNAQGIIIYGTENSPYTDVRILNNELYDCRLGYSEGIAVNGNVDGFEISGNYLHQLSNIGIDAIGFEGTAPLNDYARNGIISRNKVVECISPYDTSAGIYVDGGAHIKIMYNEVYCNGYGLEIGCENTGHESVDVEVRDNFIMFNNEAGIVVGGYDYPSGSGKVRNINIFNNTFWKNDTGTHDFGEVFLSYVENLRMENNIFYSGSDYFIYAENSQPNMQSDYNLFYDVSDGDSSDDSFEFNGTEYTGFNVYVNATGFDQHSIYTSLQLISGAGNNCDNAQPPVLAYVSGSNGINAGNPSHQPLPGETDFFGRNRILEGRVDIGAQELMNNVSISESELQKIIVFPNPAGDYLYIKASENAYGKLKYSIFSLRGELIKSDIMQQPGIKINHLKPGVYHIRFENGTHVKYIYIIKQ